MASKLTLTIRIYDPDEKQDASKSAAWSIVQVPREDLALPHDAFTAKHITPAFSAQLKGFFKP